jgi:hypothetical protein
MIYQSVQIYQLDNFEHAKETQNITYLDRLAKASVNVDWSSLPTARKIGMSSELIKKVYK